MRLPPYARLQVPPRDGREHGDSVNVLEVAHPDSGQSATDKIVRLLLAYPEVIRAQCPN